MMIARLAVLGVAAWLLPRPLLATNEEVVHRLGHEQRSESEAMENMTLESSLKILDSIPGLSSHLVSFIQESLGTHRHRLTMRSHRRFRRAAERTESAAVSDAVVKISEQIAAAKASWEVENHRCCIIHKQSSEDLEVLDQEIAQANSQSSSAQGTILKANKKIAFLSDRIPGEKDSFNDLKEQCDSNKHSLEAALQTSSSELSRLDTLPLTDCSGQFLLLQCKHNETGESFLMLNHSVQHSASAWQAPVVQKLLQEFSSGASSESGPAFFLQLKEQQDPQMCRMEANPECQQIRDRYLLMTSDYEDEGEELQDKISANENDCESKKKEAEESINNAMVQLSTAQTKLAEATADYNEAMEASRLKNDQRNTFLTNLKHESQKCASAKEDLVAQKNGLLKVRGELLVMKNMQVYIQDCKVSEWTPGECDKPCGGGVRVKTRQVLLHPTDTGADCPPLSVTEDCNTQHCSTDCSMSDWGGWSACSAKCGGGVLERIRFVERHPAHGGKPCGATQDTQTCNPQACEEDCELSEWSPWSSCSKQCDTGTTFKVKTVIKAALGQGDCPSAHDNMRRQAVPCNTQPCLQKKDAGKTLKCKSKLDVILIIDGSASLRTSGFAAVKAAGEKIAKAMGDDVNMAALLASGPKTRQDYFKCTGQKWPNRDNGTSLGAPDMATDCLISWVSHLNDNTDGVATSIAGMSWPRGSSLLSEALSLAETEVSGGRKDAKAVVVAITDGKPISKLKVAQAVKSLRTKARLMFMTSVQNAPVWLFQKWASWPVQENLIAVKTLADLSSDATVNKLVANMCPAIEAID